jgi:hypothetical protein
MLSDHAQRQVQFVEHRALLDVHLDEAQVARRVALQRLDGVSVAGRPAARIASRMRHAVGVGWSSQAGSKSPGQRARAQEGGLVALAFLFGEGHHLDAEGQAPAGGAARAPQAIGTKMPSRPSYLPPLRTVS